MDEKTEYENAANYLRNAAEETLRCMEKNGSCSHQNALRWAIDKFDKQVGDKR